MPVVYDKYVEEMKPLHDFLRTNKMTFAQFIRSVNFVRDVSQSDLVKWIDAQEENDEFGRHGQY